MLSPALLLAVCLAAAPSRTPKVAAFHAIEVSSGIEANITRGPTSLKIDADDETLALVEVEVTGEGVLKVGMKSLGFTFRRSGPVILTVTSPTLDRVHASGGSTVRAELTPAKTCAVEASGGSELHLRSLVCERLEVELSGGSQLEAVGSAKTLKLSASGGSNARVLKLTAGTVQIDGSGAAEIHARATAELTADLSGGSELYVAGRPPIRKIEASGGAQVIDVQ